jgi:hypothetical protein
MLGWRTLPGWSGPGSTVRAWTLRRPGLLTRRARPPLRPWRSAQTLHCSVSVFIVYESFVSAGVRASANCHGVGSGSRGQGCLRADENARGFRRVDRAQRAVVQLVCARRTSAMSTILCACARGLLHGARSAPVPRHTHAERVRVTAMYTAPASPSTKRARYSVRARECEHCA